MEEGKCWQEWKIAPKIRNRIEKIVLNDEELRNLIKQYAQVSHEDNDEGAVKYFLGGTTAYCLHALISKERISFEENLEKLYDITNLEI